MSGELKKVVKQPSIELQHLKALPIEKNPGLVNPSQKTGCKYQCVELFRQCCAVKILIPAILQLAGQALETNETQFLTHRSTTPRVRSHAGNFEPTCYVAGLRPLLQLL